ncbi:hypothetical protein [Azospirillum picis]|uniref:Uncharacterized protein n=1 Tax=Azospirillum picis TaxID=488438 RepID=A0ABU0MSZ6_9PROT|nr:hypothetical protein [Azospirillum picis]MBP2302771.1 hypothetical protein [Azospirillum picis]MDQ0536567.1 hypothetical protein [Azospirillum picis]
MDWQPIATAPRDGTRILVAGSDRLRAALAKRLLPEVLCFFAHWLYNSGVWVDDAMNFLNDEDLTHWSPAPALPPNTAHQRMRDAAAIERYNADSKIAAQD